MPKKISLPDAISLSICSRTVALTPETLSPSGVPMTIRDAPFGTVIRIDDQATSDAKGDPQFYPSRFGYTSGTYTINLNLNTMTLTLTKEN